MRTKNENDDKAHLVLGELAREYDAKSSQVNVAHQRLRAIVATPHRPAQAREAARDLTTALRDATQTATRALQVAALTVPPPRHHLTRRKADRSVPPAVRHWSAELVRLTDIGVWQRRTVLDDTGVQLPKAPRVANYAAKGPHIAGLDFGNQAAEPVDGPRIGIDFAAAIDSTSHSPTCGA